MKAENSALIFVIDDNPTNLRVLFSFLKEAGFRVLVAVDGVDALKKLEQITPELILLDVMMPAMDGFEVCRRLKSNPQTQDIPTIFMTALSDVKDKVYGLNLGAVDYITKPLQQEEVLSRIRLHLNLRYLTRSLQEKNQILMEEISARQAIERELHQLNQELETRVEERTSQLFLALQQLEARGEQLRYEAVHDSLTGLYNRAWLIRHLTEILEGNHGKVAEDYGILFLDLDRFKNVNDRLGHFMGDELLKEIAIRLKNCVGSYGEVTRLGGDEFLIVLSPEGTNHGVETIAQTLITQIEQPFQLGNYTLKISVSIGIIASIADYQQPGAVLRDGDIAMYQAKNKGAGTYQLLTPMMQVQALERFQLETDLRQGLEREELWVYYQPIVRLKNQEIIGFEALLRWCHPQQGLISPTRFINIAEETGLVTALDFFVLENVCQQSRVWLREFGSERLPKVNVNFSARSLQSLEVVEQIAAVVDKNGLSPSLIKLEVTESLFLETSESGAKVLQAIRDRGFALCIDDFGTGYSSLSRLQSFPVSTLKIDRSFVSPLGKKGEAEGIVQAILSLANHLGLDVVAEGIEEQEQCDLLQVLGCQFGQGYLFSQALNSQQATQLLKDAIVIHSSP